MGANEKGMKEEKWEKNEDNECESKGKKRGEKEVNDLFDWERCEKHEKVGI